MRLHTVDLGRSRTDADGSRRYRVMRVTFDTRNVVLGMDTESYAPEIQAMWQSNKEQVIAGLVGELGAHDADAKLDNYKAMGAAPWSVVYEHNRVLQQIRSAFAHGDFYPSLVASCSLGERIFNHLLIALADDYPGHRATTRRVARKQPSRDWNEAIRVLSTWGVLSPDLEATYLDLKDRRHESVHYTPSVDAAAREPALRALLLIQRIVEGLFSPHDVPSRFIENTIGGSFLALAAEQEPIVKRVYIPCCALVNPEHRIEPAEDGRETLFENADFPEADMTDAEYADALDVGRRVMHPELGG